MPRLVTVLEVWLAPNLAIPAFVLYQRSPRVRHHLLRWMLGVLDPLRDRQMAHVLVSAARHRR
jgi:hypothetical protein